MPGPWKQFALAQPEVRSPRQRILSSLGLEEPIERGIEPSVGIGDVAAFVTPAQSGSAWLALAKRFLAEEQGSARIARKLAMAPPKLKNADPITQKAFEEVVRRKAAGGRPKPSMHLSEELARDKAYAPPGTEMQETGGILANRQPRLTEAREAQYEGNPAKWVNFKERHSQKAYSPIDEGLPEMKEDFLPFSDPRYGYLSDDPNWIEANYRQNLSPINQEYRKALFTSAEKSRRDKYDLEVDDLINLLLGKKK